MLGNKQFELSNLPIAIGIGNVLTTVSDRKLPHTSDNITIDYYTSDITSAQDYYAGGMQMPGRNFSSNSYRFGFNGKENDNEVYGATGTFQDYGMRMYDTRTCRFIGVDPITKKYPELTPYQFASNTPIWGIDLDGLEVRIYTETQGTGHTFITVGDGSNIIVYTYGRYSDANWSLGTAGLGILNKFEGAKANSFLTTELYRMEAKSFEIADANESKVKNFFEAKYKNGVSSPSGSTDTKKYGKVIDIYDVFTNNCTTLSSDALKAGDSKIFENYVVIPFLNAPLVYSYDEDFAIPSSLQEYLVNRDNKNVKEVTGDLKKKYPNTGINKIETTGSSGESSGSSANGSGTNSSSSGNNSGSSKSDDGN